MKGRSVAASLAVGLILLALVFVFLAAKDPEPRLEIRAASDITNSEYHSVFGLVKNVSPDTLRNTRAVVTLLDSAGTPQATYDGPLDFEPLLSEQVSGFKVIMKLNPALTGYSLSFKDGSGRTIPHRDARQ